MTKYIVNNICEKGYKMKQSAAIKKLSNKIKTISAKLKEMRQELKDLKAKEVPSKIQKVKLKTIEKRSLKSLNNSAVKVRRSRG